MLKFTNGRVFFSLKIIWSGPSIMQSQVSSNIIQKREITLTNLSPYIIRVYVISTLCSLQWPGTFHNAVDVGCGGGQSTQVLAPFFKTVIGIDSSTDQVAQAQNNNKLVNVVYKSGSAESIDLPTSSVQLVTAGQSCHWFDLPKFYAEVERILVPGGVLALYGYLLPRPRYENKYEELCQIVDNVRAKQSFKFAFKL